MINNWDKNAIYNNLVDAHATFEMNSKLLRVLLINNFCCPMLYTVPSIVV